MITGAIADCNGNITDLDQYSDPDTKNFFLRLIFTMSDEGFLELRILLKSI